MLNNKLVWYFFLMPAAIIGWILIIYGAVFPIEDENFRIFWLVITCIWTIGHPLELIVSIPIGRKAAISTGATVLKTLLFGFTWWLPVKMKVLNR